MTPLDGSPRSNFAVAATHLLPLHFAGATDAARGAADIVLTEPGLSVIVTSIIGARKIFQRMTTYSKCAQPTIAPPVPIQHAWDVVIMLAYLPHVTSCRYTVAMTFRICFTFGLLTTIYNFYFPTILIVLLALFNDGAMIALSKVRMQLDLYTCAQLVIDVLVAQLDGTASEPMRVTVQDKVVASNLPNTWNLKNIFIVGIVYGLYLTLSSWVLFYVATHTSFFRNKIHMHDLRFAPRSYLENFCLTTEIPRGAPVSPFGPATIPACLT